MAAIYIQIMDICKISVQGKQPFVRSTVFFNVEWSLLTQLMYCYNTSHQTFHSEQKICEARFYTMLSLP